MKTVLVNGAKNIGCPYSKKKHQSLSHTTYKNSNES